MLAVAAAAILAACLSARQDGGISVGESDLGGVVMSANGPEAGVWVIAETNDLPTKFAKVVVTDDSGRYLIPELPKANYSVWVRGYGLVDSPKVQSTPGKILDLTAAVEPSAGRSPRPTVASRSWRWWTGSSWTCVSRTPWASSPN